MIQPSSNAPRDALGILSFKTGHDGAVAVVSGGRLVCSMEPEHDAFPRYAPITVPALLNACGFLDGPPDVIASGGWLKNGTPQTGRPMESGYLGFGNEAIIDSSIDFLGRRTRYFSSSHERSHIWGVYGMSPFPQGQPVYILVWEGYLGDFYEVDETLAIRHCGRVMTRPGEKYSFLFGLADPGSKGNFIFEHAGKLMALAATGADEPLEGETCG